MDQRQCENCGETVDAARAFCPGCGGPLVAEQERQQASEFEASAGTVQFGQTVYNKLLSDMGLNLADLSEQPGQKSIKPEPVQAKPAEQNPAAPKNRKTKWIIAAAGLALLLVITAGILLVSIYLYLRWEQL